MLQKFHIDFRLVRISVSPGIRMLKTTLHYRNQNTFNKWKWHHIMQEEPSQMSDTSNYQSQIVLGLIMLLKINEHQNKMTYREASYFNPAHTSETLINVIFLCPSVCLPVCLYIFCPWVGFSLISLLVWTELKNITEDGIKSKSMLAFLSHTNSAIHSKKNALHILWNLAKKN